MFRGFGAQAFYREGMNGRRSLGGVDFEFTIGLLLNLCTQVGVTDKIQSFTVLEESLVNDSGEIKFSFFLTHAEFLLELGDDPTLGSVFRGQFLSEKSRIGQDGQSADEITAFFDNKHSWA